MTSKETDAMWRTRSELPAAIRLAEHLESELPLGYMVKERAAAKELRRLHAVNTELLEALKAMLENRGVFWRNLHKEDAEITNAITAIKQARALDKMADNARELGLDYEPVQEMPITMQAGDKDCRDAEQICEELKTKVEQGQSCYCPNCEALSKELAALKAQPAPVQEPVAWILKCGEQQELWWEKPPFGDAIALHTSPPAQRTWVGLTDEEVEQACVPLGAAMLSFTEVSRAIEAKLKEKNNA